MIIRGVHMKYKAMLIDADNTIFNFTESEKRAVAMLFEQYGITAPDAESKYHAANSRQWKLLEEGKTTHAQRHHQSYNGTDSKKTSAAALAPALG